MHVGAVMAELAVQVLRDGGESWSRGSGLVVGRGLVLTAAHCVGDGGLLVRFVGGEERRATVAVAGNVETSDLALIEFNGPSPEPRWRFGEVDRSWKSWVGGCWAVGFPAYKGRSRGGAGIALLAQVGGEIPALENVGTDLLTLRLQSSPREQAEGSEWSAMSGAVVIVGDDVIVGVVGEHRHAEGADALTVFPVTALDDRAGVAEFWTRVGCDRHDLVPLPELVGRRRARRPYMATVDDLAPGLLVGRERELAELAAFATGAEGYRWVVGESCWGKTALLAQFVRACPADVDVVAYFLRDQFNDADSGRFLLRINEQLSYLLGEDEREPPSSDPGHTFTGLWAEAAARAERMNRHLLLVVDGLNEDRSAELGLPSVGSLLPRRARGHAHVLVSSRFDELPPYTPFDHPLQYVAPIELKRSPNAEQAALRLGLELKQLLAGGDVRSQALLGLLGAAGGPLSIDDLTELVRLADHTERRLGVAESVKRIRGVIKADRSQPRRYAFAHPSLSEKVEEQLGARELRKWRDWLHDWAMNHAEDGWSATSTPRFLFDAYPALILAKAPERLEKLYSDLSYVECAVHAVGVAQVEHDLLGADVKGAPFVAMLGRVLRRESHNLLSADRVGAPGYVARQLCLQALQSDAADVVQRTQAYLRTLPRPQLVPQWTSKREPAALTRLTRAHNGPVTAVAMSGDGGRAVTLGADRMMRVWDPHSGEMLGEQRRQREPVSVAISADGSCVVSGGPEGELFVWWPETEDAEEELVGHSGHVVVAVNADGTRAVSGGWDRNALVWDLTTGVVLHRLPHRDWVNAIAMSADGRRAVSICEDRSHLIWDLDSGELLQRVGGHAQLLTLAINRIGSRVISTSREGETRLWDPESGETLRALDGVIGSVTDLAMDFEGRTAVSASYGGRLQIWDLRSGRPTAVLRGHASGKAAVGLDADATIAVSGGEYGALKVWDLQRASVPDGVVTDAEGATGVAMCADAALAVSGGTSGRPLLIDVDDGKTRKVLKGHVGSVTAIAMSADGSRALSANDAGELWVWELTSGEGRVLPKHMYGVTDVAISDDGRRGVSASRDMTLRVWDLDAGVLARDLSGHLEWVTAVAISRDGKRAVSGAANRVVCHWTLDTGEILHYLKGHTGEVKTAAIHPDGRHAVSGCDKGKLIVWDLKSGDPLRIVDGHSAVSAVAIHDDRLHAVSAGEDEALRVWDLTTGACLAEFVSIPPAVALSLGPEQNGERRLLTAGGPSGITLYSLLS